MRSTHQVVAREFRSGLWAKDGSKFINIRQFLKDGRLGDIRVYEFDTGFELRAILHAGTGAWLRPGAWRLEQVTQTRLVEGRIAVTRHAELDWASSLSPTLLSALVVDPEHMALSDLSTYIAYLKHNQQQTARYELALWNKLAFPLAAPVMLFLALPFGYQPPRSHAIGGRILVGILIGMGFHMLTRMSGHVGLLNEWPAPLSAMLPTVLVTLVALAALWRVERR